MKKRNRRVIKKVSAAEAVANNEDILLEILIRLPAKSLIRFKVVSKHWKSLILNPEFGCKHTLNSSQDASSHSPSSLFLYTSSHDYFVPLSADDNYLIPFESFFVLYDVAATLGCTLRILHSCNGLFLCCLSSSFYTIQAENYLVYNPATGKTTIIPNPPKHVTKPFQLFFDPLRSPYFKVIALSSHVLMYSSETDSWRSCCHNRLHDSDMVSDGVLSDGVIYWIGCRYLHCFDINSEKATTVEMPQNWNLRNLRRLGLLAYFGEWGGHLHFIHTREAGVEQFRIHELNKDTLTWDLKYRVHVGRVISQFHTRMSQKSNVMNKQRKFSILAVIRGDMEDDSAIVLAISGRVIMFNLCNKLVREIGKFTSENPEEDDTSENPEEDDSEDDSELFAHRYMETLCPLKDPVTRDTTPMDLCELNEKFRLTLLASWNKRQSPEDFRRAVSPLLKEGNL